MKAAIIIFLFACCGCVSRATYEQSQQQVAGLKQELATDRDSLAKAQAKIAGFQAHQYQLYSVGSRTFRLDTITGSTCIKLAAKSDWKRADTKGDSCACAEFMVNIRRPRAPVPSDGSKAWLAFQSELKEFESDRKDVCGW